MIPKDCGLVPVMVRVRIPKLTVTVFLRLLVCQMQPAWHVFSRPRTPSRGTGRVWRILRDQRKRASDTISNSPRRNHVISLIRPTFANRGPSYTPYAVQIRCVRPDQSSITNTLHYLSNGSTMLRFSWRKQEYVIPIMLVLKALVGASDREIFEGIMMQDYENTFLTDRVELLLRSFKMFTMHTGEQCLEYLGDKFRVVLNTPADWQNGTVGAWLISKMILVHLDSPREKFRMLL
jgi:DNA-directed RNA polymerase I subunit RPA2